MTEEVLRTRRLEIVDNEDRARIVGEVTQDGSAIISVLDEYGFSRARMSVDAEGQSMLSVTSAAQESAVSLLVSADHRGLAISDGSETGPKGRIALHVSGEDRTAQLMITDKDNNPGTLLR